MSLHVFSIHTSRYLKLSHLCEYIGPWVQFFVFLVGPSGGPGEVEGWEGGRHWWEDWRLAHLIITGENLKCTHISKPYVRTHRPKKTRYNANTLTGTPSYTTLDE